METIIVKPRTKRQANVIESMFREMNVPFQREENRNSTTFNKDLLDKIALDVKADFDKVTDLDTFQEDFKGDFYE